MTREEVVELSRRHHNMNYCPVDGEPIMTVKCGDSWLVLWGNEDDIHYGYQRQSKMLRAFMKGVKNEGS